MPLMLSGCYRDFPIQPILPCFQYVTVLQGILQDLSRCFSGLISNHNCVDNPGSDVLEAYFVDGYQKCQAFIVTPSLQERDNDSFW